ncbi:MAG: alpha/beta hydrolase, partial [Melioribacteraceae bacterium]
MMIVIVTLFGLIFNACSSTNSKQFEQWKKMKSIKVETLIESHILAHNGNRIHYYVSGSDADDVIIFLHPAFGDHRAFNQQIDYFSSKYKVITIDLIGHDLSMVENSSDKIDKSAEHIKMILEQEGCNKVHLIGVSMGSLIAQYFALQYPEKIISMTILGGYDINKIDDEVSKFQNKGKLKWIFQAIFAMDSFRRDASSTTAMNSDSQARFYEM